MMEDNETLYMDLEFKRYLQILRPYLGQLTNTNVIAICNAWIQRLSECSEKEKLLRNRYVFALCYQLAKGMLEEPFLSLPPRGSLIPIPESVVSDDSSTEVECMVINSEEPNTEVLYDKHTALTDTDFLSQSNNDQEESKIEYKDHDGHITSNKRRNVKPRRKTSVMCYTCPEIVQNYISHDSNDIYESRASNLISKLREIKTQNILLHNELLALKEESPTSHELIYAEESKREMVREKNKVDCATSAILQSHQSNATLKSLKIKLQEVQDSRNNLIDKIAFLQEQLDNFNDNKKHEIEEIEAKHKLELIETKTQIREDLKCQFDKETEDIKSKYETKLECLKNSSLKDIQDLITKNYSLLEEKDKTIQTKDTEISNLKNQVEDLKNHLHGVLQKFIDKPANNSSGDDIVKVKAEQLEKKLNKVEKSKMKCTRIYEAKVSQLQREKHLAECSLQLQMVRQRAQVVNEVTEENQSELTAALEKLESKYKEIVANVQATVIQTRMQDQMALESILQAACGFPSESNNSTTANGQFSKTMRNQNQSINSGNSPISHCNKVGSACMANKSFGEDSLVAGPYCLNGERMGELFERVYIPQRDNTEILK